MMINRKRLEIESMLILRFALPLLIVLTMSLVVGVLIYMRTAEVVGDEVKVSNRLLLEQGMNVLDKRWEAIDTFIRRIIDDSKVVRLQQTEDPFDSAHLYQTIEARGRLQEYYTPNELVMGYYILFKKNGLVLNNDYTARMDDFTQTMRYPSKPETFVASLAETYHFRDAIPEQPVLLGGTTSSLITYMRSFGYANRPNGTVMVLIHNNEITKLFDGFRTDGGWAYIADENGQLLTGIAGPNAKLPNETIELPQGSGVISRDVDREQMIVTYVTSPYNGWTYVAAQPSKVVLKKITYIKQTTITIFVAFLLAGALVGILTAYRSSRPVRSIIQILSSGMAQLPESKARGAFGFIQQGVSVLLDSHRELQDKLERQLPYLRASFFERLLRGQYSTDADMEAVREHVRIEWAGDCYVVAIITFPDRIDVYETADIEALNERKLIVRELVSELDSTGVFIHDADENKLALLLQLAAGDRELSTVYGQANEWLNTLQLTMQRRFGIVSIISVGNAYSRTMDIFRSFLEAQQALIRSDVKQIIWYKDLLPNPVSYYYPESTETRLMNLVRTGSADQLKELLTELHRHNFADRSLPLFVLKVFLNDVQASFFKIATELGESAFISGSVTLHGLTDHVESIEAHYLALTQKLEEMCEGVARHRTESQQQWFRDVMAYVDANYADGQLYLGALAERFQVTEAHLSRLFKERNGINFFDYMEQLRIEHSKRLLLQTEQSVGEIALQVGYSSSNTFGRAFKRVVGISAMAYRNSHKQEEIKK